MKCLCDGHRRLWSCFCPCAPWAGRTCLPSQRGVERSTICCKTTAPTSTGMTRGKARARQPVPIRTTRCRASIPMWTTRGRGSALLTQPGTLGSYPGWMEEGQLSVKWGYQVSICRYNYLFYFNYSQLCFATRCLRSE
jgi:hypothetical protein